MFGGAFFVGGKGQERWLMTGTVKKLCKPESKYNENVRIGVDITPLYARGIYDSIFTQVKREYGIGIFIVSTLIS